MSQLNSIQIANYRSISFLTLNCTVLDDGSRSFGLIGLNEAGKSSILKAIALIAQGSTVAVKDFHDKKEVISVDFEYLISPEEMTAVELLLADHDIEHEYKRDSVFLGCNFDPTTFSRTLTIGLPHLDKIGFMAYPVAELPPDMLHTPIFWAARDNYLISRPIDLVSFSANPSETSVPLRNCFRLAGITDIAQRVGELAGDSTEIDQLQRELGAKVTEHIKTVWPNHPVEITFHVYDNKINFLIRDTGSGKAKTIDQRSDGFRQFISFLLTVSAENQNQELTKSVLLLDEPETHLHPLAQEYLLSELIKITKNDRDNIAIFATHSNYMIDKLDLSRNFRIFQNKSGTEISEFDNKESTYASVSYEVFSVLSRDFHTELYGRLHDRYQDEDVADEKRSSQKNFDEIFFHQKMKLPKNKPLRGVQKQVTLPTYIRNCIHHPENGDKFTEVELKDSIKLMKGA
ncbi:MAG: AAA family ATPase [Pseudomonadota bacterium]